MIGQHKSSVINTGEAAGVAEASAAYISLGDSHLRPTSHLRLPTSAFLIATLELEIPLTARKINEIHISNRDKIAIFDFRCLDCCGLRPRSLGLAGSLRLPDFAVVLDHRSLITGHRIFPTRHIPEVEFAASHWNHSTSYFLLVTLCPISVRLIFASRFFKLAYVAARPLRPGFRGSTAFLFRGTKGRRAIARRLARRRRYMCQGAPIRKSFGFLQGRLAFPGKAETHGARGGGRTHTSLSGQGILSPC